MATKPLFPEAATKQQLLDLQQGRGGVAGVRGGAGLQHHGPLRLVDQGADAAPDLSEWRSIQDVVQLTFQAFFDALRTQGDAIKGLEKSRDQLATALRTEIAAAVRGKASGTEVVGRLAEVEAHMSRKADISDVERRPLRNEVEASLRTQMADVMSVIKAKHEETASKAWQEACERQVAALRTDVARLSHGLEEVRAALGGKASGGEVREQLALKADLADVEQRLRDKASRKLVGELLSAKADAAAVEQRLLEVRHLVADLDVSVGRKTDQGRTDEVVRQVERLSTRVDADAEAATSALQALATRMEDALGQQAARLQEAQLSADRAMGAVGERVAEVEERHGAALARKADLSEVGRLMAESRAEVSVLREALSTRAASSAVAALEGQVAGLGLLPARVDALAREVAEVAAGDRALAVRLESKASVEDVNKALAEVCVDLGSRAPVEQLDALAKRLDQVAAGLTAHTLKARWLWKSGQLTAGSQVPWEVEAVNAAPGMFLWQSGQPAVVAVLPGLYRLSFGFFTRHRPLLQVLVNGEPVLTASGAASALASAAAAATAPGVSGALGPGVATAQHAQHWLASSLHSAGNVLGTCGAEFVSLPSNARVAVVFNPGLVTGPAGGGEAGDAEGFLMLHKL